MSNPPVPSGLTTKTARPRPARPAPKQRRSLLIVSIGFLVLSSLCLAAVVANELAGSDVSSARSDRSNVRADIGARTGKVLINSVQGERCRQRIFDNQTGRMVDANAPCNNSEFEANGRQIFRGTINRLDQIGKSFQNR
jgi:hypothetical protein